MAAVTFFRPQGYRAAIALMVTIELMINALYTLRNITYGYWPSWRHIPGDLATTALNVVILYVIYCAISWAGRYGFRPRLLAAMASVVVALVVQALLQPLIVWLYQDPAPDWTWERLFNPRMLVGETVRYMFTVAALLAFTLYHDVLARERQLAAAQRLAHDAQMLALQYQINPHFLFNTLNSISALVLVRENALAETLLMQLSSFLRRTLDMNPADCLMLGEEVGLQRTYLAIEQTRFQDMLRVDIDVPAPLEAALVPGLILQPLIENALKHGFSEDSGEAYIAIRARATRDQLRIEVENTTGKAAHAGTSTGLRNVRARLATHFGADAGLETDTTQPGRFRARLTMPLRLGRRHDVAGDSPPPVQPMPVAPAPSAGV